MGACAGLTYDRASFHLRQYIGAACLSLLQAWWRGASCRCQCTLFRGPSLGRRRRSLRWTVSSSALMRAAFTLQAWYRAHSHSAVPALREASVLFCHFTCPLFPSASAVHGWLRCYVATGRMEQCLVRFLSSSRDGIAFSPSWLVASSWSRIHASCNQAAALPAGSRTLQFISSGCTESV